MKKQKNNISFIDKITLCYYTFVKNFYDIYYNKIVDYHHKKKNKLITKQSKYERKLSDKYTNSAIKYKKYIAYLQYKQLHNK